MFYSEAESGFFDPDIHGDDGLPPDAILIGKDRHLELVQALAQGQELVVRGGQVMARPPAPPSHAAQRAAALQRLAPAHAAFLHAITGKATKEERDTWPVKQPAAVAVLAGDATPAQTAMLQREASRRGVTTEELAEHIIAKADENMLAVGEAGARRADALAAIIAATDEAVPLEEVSVRIQGAFALLSPPD